MSKKQREETLQRFGDNRTKARVISSVKALNQGLNVPECSLGICAAGSSMKLDNIQRTGRTLRLQEGKISLYINLFIKGSQEVKWVRKRCTGDPNVHWIDSLDDINI
jgi:superfamily II DNA or RNA helicase